MILHVAVLPPSSHVIVYSFTTLHAGPATTIIIFFPLLQHLWIVWVFTASCDHALGLSRALLLRTAEQKLWKHIDRWTGHMLRLLSKRWPERHLKRLTILLDDVLLWHLVLQRAIAVTPLHIFFHFKALGSLKGVNILCFVRYWIHIFS